ncbi:hypothetical protein POV26_09075 [Aequorivita todarodis]|uniref:hypothetical protein n=1 Tax=Aequorivita todarodis TaxID=2036821 RepID=UPI00235008A7|nr:hypothetical protein [Aequorivita todarodis]MDC8001189.1 hypothetical protein [Aequorivita todarodis]
MIGSLWFPLTCRIHHKKIIEAATQINKIDHFIDEAKEKLGKLFKESGNQEIVNNLKISFSEIRYHQKELRQLDSYTSQLNQNFFFHIQSHYENISDKDLQLLAFIILRMESKKIGRAMDISSESVYKKRYRLRKKLQLNKDESFLDFYQKTLREI